MIEIELVPGIVNFPAPITIPVGLPSIDDVVSAQIWRLPRALGLNVHPAADIAGALASHAVHNHPVDLTDIQVDDAATRVQATAAAGPGGYPGGGVTAPGGVGGVNDNILAQAHGAAGPTVAHGGAAALIEAAAPLKNVADLAERTFSLNANTALGDILTLIYLERGARLRPN